MSLRTAVRSDFSLTVCIHLLLAMGALRGAIACYASFANAKMENPKGPEPVKLSAAEGGPPPDDLSPPNFMELPARPDSGLKQERLHGELEQTRRQLHHIEASMDKTKDSLIRLEEAVVGIKQFIALQEAKLSQPEHKSDFSQDTR